MSAVRHTAAEIDSALALSKRIDAKADLVLVSLVREMKLMGWKPEFQSIMWNTIARKATRYADDARAVIEARDATNAI